MDENTVEKIITQETLADKNNQQRNLLIVDNDSDITSSLANILKRRHYRVIKANSGQEGLKILEQEKMGVVISEQRMPEMSGVEFLTKVYELYPDMMRIILAGKADMDAVIDAVKKGAVYKFITKPCEEEELANSVDQYFQHHELIVERRELMSDIARANSDLQLINNTLNQTIESKSQELIEITQHDQLTKLPNRLLFMDRLQQAVLNAKKSGKHVAIIVLGLDSFKLVNNSYGNLIGDKLLMLIAERIAKNTGDNNTVARITGDEFAILLTELNSPQSAAHVIDDIYKSLAAPFLIDTYELYTQASIGVSIFPEDDESAEYLLQNAYTAMNTAKEQETGSFQFYTSDMHISVSERLGLENDLRRAIAQDEFSVQYQPQINIITKTLSGMEALIRWKHPVKGFISPAIFVPILEEIGLISTVGDWVLKTVCEQHRAWRQAGYNIPRVSVNLSVRQFDDDNLVSRITRILEKADFNPKEFQLELEVTESLVIQNYEKIIKILNQFNNKNIRIAIDDFGTGYASLSYLTQFHIHALKIDLSFIRRINNGESDRAIIVAIIALAHSIGLTVIAEGAENEEQVDFLLENECDEVQGYYFSKPLRPDDLLSYVNNDSYKDLLIRNNV